MKNTEHNPESLYNAVHEVVRYLRGRPSFCEGCGIEDAKRYEWADLSGDILDFWGNYARLCVSCHKRHDWRRSHDEREDHRFEPTSDRTARCRVCRKRYSGEYYKQYRARNREHIKECKAQHRIRRLSNVPAETLIEKARRV